MTAVAAAAPLFSASNIGAAGSLLSGLGSLGGMFGSKSSGPKRKHIRMAYDEANRNIPMQVEAYKKAGIHPLYGMGSSTYQPISSASSGGDSGSDFGRSLEGFGQNISRAAAAYQTAGDRKVKEVHDRLTLENMSLQNDLLRAQTTRIQNPTSPALPSITLPPALSGQGDSALPGFDGSASADASFSQGRDGSFAVVPGEDTKQKIEDMMIPEIQWYLRQVMAPTPKGYFYNPLTSTMKKVPQYTRPAWMDRIWKNRSRTKYWKGGK